MKDTDKNNFPKEARKALIDLGWSIQDLADKVKRPRSTISTAIYTARFPLVRKQIAEILNLTLSA